MKLFGTVVLLLFVAGGCTDAQRQGIESLGSKHHVTLYGASGNVIKEWTASGQVSNESQSDGWYFRDEATGKLIEITGTIVVEQE